MFVNRALLGLAGASRLRIGLVILIQVLITVTHLAQAVLLATAVAELLEGAGLDRLVPFIAGIATAIVVRAGLVWLAEVQAGMIERQVSDGIRSRLFTKLFALGPSYVTGQRTGELRAVLTSQTDTIGPYCARYLPALASTVLGPVAALAIIGLHSGWAALAGLLAVVFWLVVPSVYQTRMQHRNDIVWQELGTLDADFVDAFQGLPTLKSLGVEAVRRTALREQSERVRSVLMSQFRVSFLSIAMMRFAIAAGTAVMLALTALAGGRGEITAVGMLTILFVAPEVFRPINAYRSHAFAAFTAKSAASAINALLDEAEPAPSTTGSSAPTESAGSQRDGARQHVVEFVDVSYRYPGRDGDVVSGVSFRIEPGRTLALVGRSGSGKSTVGALLTGFLYPDRGTILLDGVDRREIPDRALRSMIAVVSQETHLFHGTIGDNIAMGRSGASLVEVRQAAANAGLADFIESLPHGYETQIGERGVALSGGQRQRIAIARALIKDAPILILDEATSNVDAASEAVIQDALDRVAANKTTLVIAHRLSTVQEADEILVLDDGRVVERGHATELIATGGAFARLVAHQEGVLL